MLDRIFVSTLIKKSVLTNSNNIEIPFYVLLSFVSKLFACLFFRLYESVFLTKLFVFFYEIICRSMRVVYAIKMIVCVTKVFAFLSNYFINKIICFFFHQIARFLAYVFVFVIIPQFSFTVFFFIIIFVSDRKRESLLGCKCSNTFG